jgi:hypothetical protein
MSRASKLTLLGTSLFAATTVIFVHFQQKSEKEVCTPQCSVVFHYEPTRIFEHSV